MYSKQLLIKMNEDMLNQLKTIADKMGLKISTFARMILKNNLEKIQEDTEDIRILKKHRHEKGNDFDNFVKGLIR